MDKNKIKDKEEEEKAICRREEETGRRRKREEKRKEKEKKEGSLCLEVKKQDSPRDRRVRLEKAVSGFVFLHHLLHFCFGILMKCWIYDGYMICFDLEPLLSVPRVFLACS